MPTMWKVLNISIHKYFATYKELVLLIWSQLHFIQTFLNVYIQPIPNRFEAMTEYSCSACHEKFCEYSRIMEAKFHAELKQICQFFAFIEDLFLLLLLQIWYKFRSEVYFLQLICPKIKSICSLFTGVNPSAGMPG